MEESNEWGDRPSWKEWYMKAGRSIQKSLINWSKVDITEKTNVDKELEHYKVWFMVKGYKQQKGIDYYEVFSPITKKETIQLLFSLTTKHEWKIEQMDLKFAFFNEVLEKEVYVEQPLDYMRKCEENKV